MNRRKFLGTMVGVGLAGATKAFPAFTPTTIKSGFDIVQESGWTYKGLGREYGDDWYHIFTGDRGELHFYINNTNPIKSIAYPETFDFSTAWWSIAKVEEPISIGVCVPGRLEFGEGLSELTHPLPDPDYSEVNELFDTTDEVFPESNKDFVGYGMSAVKDETYGLKFRISRNKNYDKKIG